MTGAESGANEFRFREVSAIVSGGAGVTLTQDLGGTDNAADSIAVVSLVTFNHASVIQLLRGKVKVQENRTLGTDL